MINSINDTAKNGTSSSLICNSAENPSHNIMTNLGGLTSLPVELHRKIAFNLDANDYANLRATCSTLRDSLYSFAELINISSNEQCKSSLKKASEIIIEDMRHSRLKDKIYSERYIHQALRSLEVEYISVNKRFYYILFKTDPDIHQNNREDFINTFKLIKYHMGRDFFIYNVLPDRCSRLLSFNVGFDMGIIDYRPDDISPAKSLFVALQNCFDITTTLNKYIIAGYAAKLIQVWSTSPSTSTDKKTIDEIALSHSKLIAVGKLAHQFAMEKTL